jgi:hypothetical protein
MDEENLDLSGGEGVSYETNENETQDEAEFDEFGAPLEEVPEPVETPAEATEERETPPQAEFRASRPFVPTGNPHMDRVRQRLEEVGLGDVADDLSAAMRHEQQQGFTAQTYAGNYLGQAQQAVPDYYRANADAIAEGAAMAPPELKGTPAGAVFALFVPIMRRATETGNVGQAVQEAARLMGNAPAAPKQTQTTRTVAKVPQTPSPSAAPSGGSAPRTPAKQLQQSGSLAARYLQGLDVPADEARRLARNL